MLPPQGIRQFKRVEAIIEVSISDLPALFREEYRDLIKQIAEMTARLVIRHLIVTPILG
mgnify:FL=1|tara:strand:- start:807 stop:983 length:177 start_codon:yes stop_codon:yes gene_type:complete